MDGLKYMGVKEFCGPEDKHWGYPPLTKCEPVWRVTGRGGALYACTPLFLVKPYILLSDHRNIGPIIKSVPYSKSNDILQFLPLN